MFKVGATKRGYLSEDRRENKEALHSKERKYLSNRGMNETGETEIVRGMLSSWPEVLFLVSICRFNSTHHLDNHRIFNLE